MKPYILMIGSHPTRVIGGIATMIQTILESPLADQFDIEHIPSVVDGSKLQKWAAVARGLTLFVHRLLTRRVSLVYVHIGGDKSVYRKAAFILLGKLFGRKMLLHVHGGNTARYYYEQPRLAQWYLRSVLRMGDRFLVVSEALQKILPECLPDREIHLLCNAVNPPVTHVGRVMAGPVRVVYLGHFLKLKGIYDLVDAIPRILREVPDAKYLLCGLHEVEQVRDRCQRQGVLPAVEHLGPVPFQERWSALRQADIFVLPSYEEGLPVTILEAMAIGLPIVATPVGGIPHLIEDGRNGFLVPPGDVDALAARIVRLARDPQLRERMGAANRARVAEEFDASAFIENLNHHLQCMTKTATVEMGRRNESVSQPTTPRR